MVIKRWDKFELIWGSTSLPIKGKEGQTETPLDPKNGLDNLDFFLLIVNFGFLKYSDWHRSRRRNNIERIFSKKVIRLQFLLCITSQNSIQTIKNTANKFYNLK